MEMNRAADWKSELLGLTGLEDTNLDNRNRRICTSRFAIVERRRLWRDCLIRCFGALHPDVAFVAYDTVHDCVDSMEESQGISAIFLGVEQTEFPIDEIRKLVERFDPIPVVVLSDSEDFSQFVAARQWGVKGCVSANFSLETVFEAMKTGAAGGFVMTAAGIDTIQRAVARAPRPVEESGLGLTSRQAIVAEALRQGKPNKIIAYELGMCENTVKVHVRNILTKLNVTNRTEAAFKLNEQHTARMAEQAGSTPIGEVS